MATRWHLRSYRSVSYCRHRAGRLRPDHLGLTDQLPRAVMFRPTTTCGARCDAAPNVVLSGPFFGDGPTCRRRDTRAFSVDMASEPTYANARGVPSGHITTGTAEIREAWRSILGHLSPSGSPEQVEKRRRREVQLLKAGGTLSPVGRQVDASVSGISR